MLTFAAKGLNPMNLRWKVFFSALLVIFLLASCAPASPATIPTRLPPTPTPEPTPLPAPSRPGDAIQWNYLTVQMSQAEITNEFITEFGSQRIPSPGQKFLWIRIRLENTGSQEINLPGADHFSVLYADSELKPTYGHRQDHPDYTAQTTPLYPGQVIEAWLRFDIPATAELQALRFVFMPESVQLGVRPVSAGYPWGGEHPIFVWECKK